MNKILNTESFFRRLENDKELINEILQLFIDTIPAQINSLKTAVEENDTETIQLRAHALKGAAGNISAEKLEKTAAQLETTQKEGKPAGSGLLLSKLLEEYEELENEIVKLLDSP